MYGEVRDVHGGRPHWRFRLALRERPAPLHQTPPRSLLLVARFEIPFRKERVLPSAPTPGEWAPSVASVHSVLDLYNV